MLLHHVTVSHDSQLLADYWGANIV